MQNYAKKNDMKIFYTLLLVGFASLLLIEANKFTQLISLQIHANSFVNGLFNFQIYALSIGILTTLCLLYLNPESRQFLAKGDLNVIAESEKWLGINGRSTWKINGIQLLIFISMATSIFMFLAVKQTNSLNNFHWRFIPLILLFSLSNSLTEELIFRFGTIGGLFHHYSKQTICILSAVLFGLPHYYGWPNGFVGVLMAGVLGYVLCKATIETKGLLIAWTIHFVQDIIIFTALIMMNVKN
jgi:membrane protease YdiL (CAAX protease family)